MIYCQSNLTNTFPWPMNQYTIVFTYILYSRKCHLQRVVHFVQATVVVQWRHRSESTVAMSMASYLTAPNHYLNQCWLFINKVQWHSSVEIFIRNTPKPSITTISFNYSSKITFKLFRDQWIDTCPREARPRLLHSPNLEAIGLSVG